MNACVYASNVCVLEVKNNVRENRNFCIFCIWLVFIWGGKYLI